ncbi:MAG TPA: cytochrome C oxidase Cbb3, partial [Myxococcota bacterium]|nr:cytochrome C oxidase Cbb3 [Myxococcota bacterium]
MQTTGLWLLGAAAAAGVGMGGCDAPGTEPAAAATTPALPASTRAEGIELIRRFECERCHDGVGLTVVPRERHCVHCHREILDGHWYSLSGDDVKGWRSHHHSLPAVPSLAGVAARFRRAWVKAFLLSPHDLRPGLPAEMPRLALAPDDAEAIAAWLVPKEAPPPDRAFTPEEAARGAALYARLRCATCHAFTGVAVALPDEAAGAEGAGPAAKSLHDGAAADAGAMPALLAPDLRVTRERFQPRALADFLADPRRLAPETVMPDMALSGGDARALAAFILTAPLAPLPPPAAIPARPLPLAREVRWPEVEARVFKKVCWHCHASAAYALGDGGAGNTGGFGFAPRGLDLSTPTGVFSGAFGDDGRRRSVLAPLAEGTPRLIAHLLARWSEESGSPVPGVRGMPLALPPLPPADIQLVVSWIAQGR